MKCFWGYIYCVWQCGLRILWYYFTAGPIFFGVRFVPYALFLSCLLSSTQTHCLKSLFLKTNSHVTGKRCERSCHTGHSYLWTPPGHQFEMAHFVSQKKKKKSCLAQSDVTVQYLCHARLDSPSRTAPVCRLPPLFAWFVSSLAGSSGVSGTSWVWPDSVASLWTAEVLLLSNSRSASSWRPWAGRSMTAPDRAAADRDTLTPDEWRSRYSCGLYILHRDAPWMHTAWSD